MRILRDTVQCLAKTDAVKQTIDKNPNESIRHWAQLYKSFCKRIAGLQNPTRARLEALSIFLVEWMVG